MPIFSNQENQMMTNSATISEEAYTLQKAHIRFKLHKRTERLPEQFVRL